MTNTLKELFNYIDNSPCSFYAIENLSSMLINAGFTELKESDSWKLKPGKKYFVIRNGSSIISFIIPESESINRFLITATHSDSPCFKLKPEPEQRTPSCVTLNVERYGGMLLNPWFDRPLSLAGRITYATESGRIKTQLVNINKDLLMIPNLAIHFNRDANTGHEIDFQSEMMPVVSINQDFSILDLLEKETDINKENILGYDLFVYNREKGKVWGSREEFISSPRLDDLECVWTTAKAFIESKPLQNSVLVHAVFDNEETGSMSRQGADSSFLEDVLKRIMISCDCNEESFYKAIASSFLISADNAHGLHPNYQSKSDEHNRPLLNKGPVLKFNASQKYTTDGLSTAVLKSICKKAQVPFQIFTNNSNIAGGSTLGNISNSHVSLLSADIGLAQWAMHSPNESGGAEDPQLMINLIKEFYKSEDLL